MASCFILFRVLFLLFTNSDLFVQSQVVNLGINYGQIANNIPTPSSVAVLLKSLNVSRVKIYDANPNVVSAFSNSNVELMIGLGDESLENIKDPANAQSWIQHVIPYLSNTKITCLVVGNEVLGGTGNDIGPMINLLPAIKTVYNSLLTLNLSQQVTVATAHSFNILSNSFPPSSGAFRQDLIPYIQPLLNFQSQIKSPFLINVYPFFAYKGDPKNVPLNYVLFQQNQGSIDPITNLVYDNMLYAQVDAVYAAIKALGHTDIEVRISETGWPSKGDPDEIGANPTNAKIYNTNLLKRVQSKQGTPAHPSIPLDVHLFSLFNENLKPGPESERNYGLYYPDETPVYDIGLQFQNHHQGLQMGIESRSNGLSINFLFYLLTCLVFLMTSYGGIAALL